MGNISWVFRRGPNGVTPAQASFNSAPSISVQKPAGNQRFGPPTHLPQLASQRSTNGLRSVVSALDALKASCARIGLELAPDNRELLPTAGVATALDLLHVPNDILANRGDGLNYLAAPSAQTKFCHSRARKRVDEAKLLLQAIVELLDPQVALMLFRYSASFGKLVYSTRGAPPNANATGRESFAEAVRQCFEEFTSLRLGQDLWGQAALFIKQKRRPRPEMRSVRSPAAYLATHVACREFCAKLNRDRVWEIESAASAATRALEQINNEAQLVVPFAVDNLVFSTTRHFRCPRRRLLEIYFTPQQSRPRPTGSPQLNQSR
jgi:hypothetical protein